MGYRDYSTAKGHIVDANGFGDFTTIGAALTAASSGQTIFIRPGTYTENPTLKAGVDLVAYTADAYTPNVTIVGECAASFSGTASFSGIQFETNSNPLLSVTGSSSTNLNFSNCYFNCSTTTGFSISSTGSGTVSLFQCNGNLGTTGIAYFTVTNSSSVVASYCYFTNSAGGDFQSTFSNTSSFSLSYSTFTNAIQTNNTALLTCRDSDILTSGEAVSPITLTGTQTGHTITGCRIEAGNQQAITIGTGSSATILGGSINTSYTDAIGGSGSASVGGVVYVNSSGVGTTLTGLPFLVTEGGTGVTSTTAYGVVCGGTTSTAALQNAGAGSSGQVLVSQGSSALPQWTAASAVAGLILIAEQTASSSATISFTSGLTAYNVLYIVATQVTPATNTALLLMEMSNNGGSSWITSGYTGVCNNAAYNTGTLTNTNSTAAWALSGPLSNGSSNNTLNAVFTLHGVNQANQSYITGTCSYYDTTASAVSMGIIGGASGGNGVNAIQFLMSSGNIATGRFSVFGVAGA